MQIINFSAESLLLLVNDLLDLSKMNADKFQLVPSPWYERGGRKGWEEGKERERRGVLNFSLFFLQVCSSLS